MVTINPNSGVRFSETTTATKTKKTRTTEFIQARRSNALERGWRRRACVAAEHSEARLCQVIWITHTHTHTHTLMSIDAQSKHTLWSCPSEGVRPRHLYKTVKTVGNVVNKVKWAAHFCITVAWLKGSVHPKHTHDKKQNKIKHQTLQHLFAADPDGFL